MGIPRLYPICAGFLLLIGFLGSPGTVRPDPIPRHVPPDGGLPIHAPGDVALPEEAVPSEFLGFPGASVVPFLDLDVSEAAPIAPHDVEAVRLRPSPPADPPILAPYPVILNDRVQHFIDRFRSPERRERVTLWLYRSGRYLDMIRKVFRERGLPEDLAFMAMVESGFNPLAVSRARAKGLWQFMKGTARRYGLRVDRWVDERLDPYKATVAAADYLEDLYLQFGSWFLAQAAYNAGERKVIRALRRSRGNDFWKLLQGRFLKRETKHFVPAILAATLIGRDPERYGFSAVTATPLEYDVVMAPSRLPLKLLARHSSVSLRELRTHNLELRRGRTPPGGPYRLKVPKASAGQIQAALKRLKRTIVHVVRPRETLSHIAVRYGVTVTELVRLNGIRNRSLIYPGDRIRVVVR
ncbi:MAG: transglycosylase SLT domain-containing protein [Candidatus Methylomirabilia bacterium]